jgi:DNA-binding transcriptional MerR regulator
MRRVEHFEYARSQVAAVKDEKLPASPGLLSIGELAERSGVATTALRYYDQLGLLRPTERGSGGRRRYAASAVAAVGVIRFLREVGFTLAEVDSFLAASEQRSRQEVIGRKLAEVTEQQHRLEVARDLLQHGRTCAAGDPLECSRFWSIIARHRHGLSIEESHAREHEANPSPTARRFAAPEASVLVDSVR